LDGTLQPVDGQIHLGQADRRGVLLQAVEGEAFGRGLAVLFFHYPGALNEHAAGAAGGVEHNTAVGVQDVGDERDQRDGGEELAAVVGLLVGELGEEVFVDAAEDIAGDALQRVGVERAQELAQHGVIQLLVFVLGQHAAQAVVVGLN